MKIALTLHDKMTLLAFRFVIFLLLTFFVLESAQEASLIPLALCGLYLASTVALWFVPELLLQAPRAHAALLLADVCWITAVLYLGHGWDGDLYLVYFLVIFMTGIQADMKMSFLTGTVACCLYGAISVRGGADWLSTPFLLRLPFFYMVAFFATLFSSRAKQAEERVENRYRSRIEASERRLAVGRLAGKIASEINDPLSIIWGFSQSLLTRVPAGDALRMPVESIARETERCASLIRTFLLLTADAAARRGAVALNTVVRDTLEALVAAGKVPAGAEVRLELDEDIPFVMGEKGELSLAIEHLVTNALEADPAGLVTVRTMRRHGEPDKIRLEVRDTGRGIPGYAHRHVFEPFFTTKPRQSGAGLGLCFVSTIAHRHQADLSFDSEPGKGSVFSLEVPVYTGRSA